MLDIVRALLDYDPETGVFLWRVTRRGTARAGTVAGKASPSGHRRLTIHNRGYLAHRVAWLYVHGTWPDGPLDHINGEPGDNRIDNLRLATPAQNAHNSAVRRTNTSGFKGATFNKKTQKWMASIQHKYLGSFETAEQAAAVYRAAAQQLYGEFYTDRGGLQ